MKSALILVGTLMAMASAHATTLTLSCQSSAAQLTGSLEVDASGNATGKMATTVASATGVETSTVDFSGSYHVYPAGSFCATSTVTYLMVSGETASGTEVGVKSVRGVDCQPNFQNGDVIYVSKDSSVATCTLTK